METKKENAAENFQKMVDRFINEAIYVSNLSDTSPYFPQHLHIGPTNACNLRCVHCHYHLDNTGKTPYTRKKGMMKLETHHKIIDEVAPKNCSITYSIHGEPTLNPKFPEMVGHCKKYGLYTSLLTNGTKLDAELADKLTDLKIDRVVFSFDAIEKNLYEEIRVRANFEETLKNILNFAKVNHEKGHPTHICMSVVLQERTKDHIETYKEYFKNLPIDKVFISGLLTLSGGSGAKEEIDLDKLRKDTPRKDWPMCRIPWEDIAITWDGEVIVCPLDYNVYYSVGNVKNNTLQELWNNERFKKFRKAHLDKDYKYIQEIGPLCEECNCLWDPEYDIRNFKEFATRAIYRQAVQYAHQFCEENTSADNKEKKYENTLKELAKLDN